MKKTDTAKAALSVRPMSRRIVWSKQLQACFPFNTSEVAQVISQSKQNSGISISFQPVPELTESGMEPVFVSEIRQPLQSPRSASLLLSSLRSGKSLIDSLMEFDWHIRPAKVSQIRHKLCRDKKTAYFYCNTSYPLLILRLNDFPPDELLAFIERNNL